MAPKSSSSFTFTKPSSQSASSSSNTISTTASGSISALLSAYTNQTTPRLKFIDAFLVFLVSSGVLQFAYCVLVTNFPFNAFLAGFSSTVGQFVLTASLRQQVNPENKVEFKEVSHERAFADFVLGSIVLHFFVYNFLG